MNGGFNVSTSTNGHYANAPAAYYIVPNSFQPDQQTLYIERQPDTVQTDHFDCGFRITNLDGIDYRFTTAKEWFSSQLLGHTNSNGSIGYQYGYDMVMAYADLYFPHVAQGLNVRIGRDISLPDMKRNWRLTITHIATPCCTPTTRTPRPELICHSSLAITGSTRLAFPPAMMLRPGWGNRMQSRRSTRASGIRGARAAITSTAA
jgi:hypothetical protein